ncbi:hypothetical protein, partial [Nocardia brasiliensis]|uniref:hypothetical protein n=1 Tax=Nocardia brasiliensis TaxID=37326 RepID=UPI002454986C
MRSKSGGGAAPRPPGGGAGGRSAPRAGGEGVRQRIQFGLFIPGRIPEIAHGGPLQHLAHRV